MLDANQPRYLIGILSHVREPRILDLKINPRHAQMLTPTRIYAAM
jgi:hypothetical protein